MPLESIVGTLGGQLGVWTGASVLTLAQLVIHLLLALCRDDRSAPAPSTVDDEQPIRRPTRVARAWWDDLEE